jgi:phosphatidylserine synthase
MTPLLLAVTHAAVGIHTALAVLFIHPIKLPPGTRIWMLFPLVFCVAAVYRASRARSPAEIVGPTIRTFLGILLGMFAIAVGLLIAHEIVLRYF